jgi:hypothetical protein
MVVVGHIPRPRLSVDHAGREAFALWVESELHDLAGPPTAPGADEATPRDGRLSVEVGEGLERPLVGQRGAVGRPSGAHRSTHDSSYLFSDRLVNQIVGALPLVVEDSGVDAHVQMAGEAP